ncbi:MAG TPA: phosphatase PAP2 family protein [Vicinamibacterales bacterium]|nr:phosphatase PAP2 family protein [Vicinamibacterales bacterium]
MIPASILYFAYVAAVALLLPGLPRHARRSAVAAAAAGLILTAITAATTTFWLRDVLLPPILLLVAYWASGLLWVAPMPRVERALGVIDARLKIPPLVRRMPRSICELLELAYAGVYPLVPVALVLHLAWGPDPDAAHFWTVVLVTDYICFAMLPWIQTRPPRGIEACEPWHSGFRALNLKLLGQTSIGVNTVPSGHAAEALAAALLLADAPAPIPAAMAVAAMAVSAGAVLGRYHYAVDALAGWAVAGLVWMVLGKG